jgi:hypothetical protein
MEEIHGFEVSELRIGSESPWVFAKVSSLVDDCHSITAWK